MIEVRKQYTARARPVGLYPLAAGMHWVAMPDFNGALSAQAYEKLYPQLATVKKSGWVVFDLRGNGGGDSNWGSRAPDALYGKEYSERLNGTAAYPEVLIADQATIDLYRRYANLPEYSASKSQFDDIAKTLETAVRSGEKIPKWQHHDPVRYLHGAPGHARTLRSGRGIYRKYSGRAGVDEMGGSQTGSFKARTAA